MTFKRIPSPKWFTEVPGARWFRADLHVHTLDDHPGGRAKVPAALSGQWGSPDFLGKVARTFLKAAVAAHVDVIALTPHAAKMGSAPESSAVWAIVDCWNTDNDDDGIPFRDKIYAIFPGFEPSFNVGREGLHLLFLFDPEIGREHYLNAFTLVMGGVDPWNGNELMLSSLHAHEAFEKLRSFRQRQDSPDWSYLVLAPHVDSAKGLFSTQKSQVLGLFQHDEIAALEIGDNQLPDEIIKNKGNWFEDGLRRYRQSLYHASDAYKVATSDAPGEFELGHRVTWIKLAQPRVEALRQAFLASDSRVQIAYTKGGDRTLVERQETPCAMPTNRPWLRSVTISGGVSFFGGMTDGQPITTEFRFNPGLTCIIGGSMTGKSTLLDGLRSYTRADLPKDPTLAQLVQRRAGIFLSGHPTVVLDTPGRVGTDRERWPAVFYTQNELQSLMRDPAAAEEILRGLAGQYRDTIADMTQQIDRIGERLSRMAQTIAQKIHQRSEAEQSAGDAEAAATALESFQKAGTQDLRECEAVTETIQAGGKQAVLTLEPLVSAQRGLQEGAISPESMVRIQLLLGHTTPSDVELLVERAHRNAVIKLDEAKESLLLWQKGLDEVHRQLQALTQSKRLDVERKLVELGYGPERLAEFNALSRKAAFRDSYADALAKLNDELSQEKRQFEQLCAERARLVEQLRAQFDGVMVAVEAQFAGDARIRIRRIENALADSLDAFVKRLQQSGISRWWNGLDPGDRPSPERIYQAFVGRTLVDLKMSATVADRFSESLTEALCYQLRALRSTDRYVFEQRLDNGEFREAERLSGGRRVGLLLTLLLQVEDDRPLVIDQPEDELDNSTLWSTVLPALRKLKARRQILLVTHNANIVVNGDADLVILLEADADRGRVALAGAIEDEHVRQAIVNTVDGGKEAFELRKVKYGF